jgi:hypothetical protein
MGRCRTQADVSEAGSSYVANDATPSELLVSRRERCEPCWLLSCSDESTSRRSALAVSGSQCGERSDDTFIVSYYPTEHNVRPLPQEDPVRIRPCTTYASCLVPVEQAHTARQSVVAMHTYLVLDAQARHPWWELVEAECAFVMVDRCPDARVFAVVLAPGGPDRARTTRARRARPRRPMRSLCQSPFTARGR